MEMQLEIALHNTHYSNSHTDMKPQRLLSVKITRVEVKLKVMQNTSGRHQIDRQCSGIRCCVTFLSHEHTTQSTTNRVEKFMFVSA